MDLRAAQHALCPEAAAAGGMGIADTVLPVLLKQLAVAAVETGGKFKFIEFPAEGFIFPAVPDLGQGLLPDIAEGTMGDLPADIVHVSIAVVQQRHAGSNLPVSADKSHAFPDEFAVAGLL